MKTCKEECLNFLKYSRTEKEVRDYLSEKKYYLNDINESIEYAKELKYIDDYDYTYAYVNDHLLINKWGPLKIKYKLKEKGINDDLIDNALLDNEDKIINNLNNLITKKSLNIDISNYNDLKKIISHAINKGYEYYMVIEALRRNE